MTSRKSRRISSILKKSPSRTGLLDEPDDLPSLTNTGKENEFTNTKKRCSRRVSFANSNQIKEIARAGDIANEWQDSSSDSSNNHDPSSLLQHKVTRSRPSSTGKPLQDLTKKINGLNRLLSAPIVNTATESIKEARASSSFFDNSIIQLGSRVETPEVSPDVSVENVPTDNDVKLPKNLPPVNIFAPKPALCPSYQPGSNLSNSNEEITPKISASKLLAMIGEDSPHQTNTKPRISAANLLAFQAADPEISGNENEELPDEPERTTQFRPNFNSTMVGQNNTGVNKTLLLSEDLDLTECVTGHGIVVSEPVQSMPTSTYPVNGQGENQYDEEDEDKTKVLAAVSYSVHSANNTIEKMKIPINEDATMHYGKDEGMDLTECVSENQISTRSSDNTRAICAVDFLAKLSGEYETESSEKITRMAGSNEDKTIHFGADGCMDITECIDRPNSSTIAKAIAISSKSNISTTEVPVHAIEKQDMTVHFNGGDGMDMSMTECISKQADSAKVLLEVDFSTNLSRYGDISNLSNGVLPNKSNVRATEDATIRYNDEDMDETECIDGGNVVSTAARNILSCISAEVSNPEPSGLYLADKTVHFGNEGDMEMTECLTGSNNNVVVEVEGAAPNSSGNISCNNSGEDIDDKTIHFDNDMEITECINRNEVVQNISEIINDSLKNVQAIVDDLPNDHNLSNDDKTVHFDKEEDAGMDITECLPVQTNKSLNERNVERVEEQLLRQNQPNASPKFGMVPTVKLTISHSPQAKKNFVIAQSLKSNDTDIRVPTVAAMFADRETSDASNKSTNLPEPSTPVQNHVAELDDEDDEQYSMQSTLKKRLARVRSSLGVYAARMKRRKLSAEEDEELSVVDETDRENNIITEASRLNPLDKEEVNGDSGDGNTETSKIENNSLQETSLDFHNLPPEDDRQEFPDSKVQQIRTDQQNTSSMSGVHHEELSMGKEVTHEAATEILESVSEPPPLVSAVVQEEKKICQDVICTENEEPTSPNDNEQLADNSCVTAAPEVSQNNATVLEESHNKSVTAELWYEKTFSLEDDKEVKNIEIKKFLKLYTDIVIPNPDTSNRRSVLTTNTPPFDEMPTRQKLAMMFKPHEHTIYQQFLESLDSNVAELKKGIGSLEADLSEENPLIFKKIRCTENEDERNELVETLECLVKSSKSIAKAQSKKVKGKLYKGLLQSLNRLKTGQLDEIINLVQHLNKAHAEAGQEISNGIRNIENKISELKCKEVPTNEQMEMYKKHVACLEVVKSENKLQSGELESMKKTIESIEEKRAKVIQTYDELHKCQVNISSKRLQVKEELKRYESFLGFTAKISSDQVVIDLLDSTLRLEASSVVPISGSVLSMSFANYKLNTNHPGYMPTHLQDKYNFTHRLIKKRVNIEEATNTGKSLLTVINHCKAASLPAKVLFRELHRFLAINRCSVEIIASTVLVEFSPKSLDGPFNWYSVTFNYEESKTSILLETAKEYLPSSYSITTDDNSLYAQLDKEIAALITKKSLKEIVQVLLKKF